MDVRGKRVLIFGDSLSHRGARTAPDGVPAVAGLRAGAPGDVLGSNLLAAGAAAVRINGRVSRSAVNLFNGTNGEDGAAVLAAEAAQRPQIVIVFLGTNDIGWPQAADAAGFRRIATAFSGAQLIAVGPPSFARADLMAGAPAVYSTLASVFPKVIDLRPMTADILTPAAGRAGDGVHFSGDGGALVAGRLAAVLAAGNGSGVVTSAMPQLAAWWPWTLTAAVAMATVIGVALVIQRRQQLGAVTVADDADGDDLEDRPSFYKQSAAGVNAAAAALARQGKSFGSFTPKVYLTDLAKALGLSMARLAPILIKLQRRGLVELVRIDLPSAHDPKVIDESTIGYRNSTINAVVVPR